MLKKYKNRNHQIILFFIWVNEMYLFPRKKYHFHAKKDIKTIQKVKASK